jgi:hypothetical protein
MSNAEQVERVAPHRRNRGASGTGREPTLDETMGANNAATPQFYRPRAVMSSNLRDPRRPHYTRLPATFHPTASLELPGRYPFPDSANQS